MKKIITLKQVRNGNNIKLVCSDDLCSLKCKFVNLNAWLGKMNAKKIIEEKMR